METKCLNTRSPNSLCLPFIYEKREVENEKLIKKICTIRYPMSPPVVRFLTRILHPNVSRHGDVGIDSVHHNWSLALTLSKVLISIQSLLTDPYTTVRVLLIFLSNFCILLVLGLKRITNIVYNIYV